jgi:hypothetical protein
VRRLTEVGRLDEVATVVAALLLMGEVLGDLFGKQDRRVRS